MSFVSLRRAAGQVRRHCTRVSLKYHLMPSTLCLLQYTPCDSPGMLKRACVPHSGTAHSLTMMTSAAAWSG